MDRGAGADRSADGRQFHPPQSLGGVKLRRANILSDILSFEDARRRRRTCALRRGRFPRRHGTGRRRIEAERIEADTAPRPPVQTTFEWLLRQDSPAAGRSVPDTVRLNPALVAIEQFAPRFGTPAGVLRHAALCPPSGAHRRTGRLLHRGRHPHGRPAREVPTGLRRGRRGLRPDGIAPDGLPAHDQNPVERLDGIQHHAAQSGAPQNLRGHFFVSGWVCPALGGRLHAVGKHRLPAAARLLHRGTGVLHQPRRQPHRTDAQRFAPPRIRGRRSRRRPAGHGHGAPYPFAGIQGELRDGRVHRLRRCLPKPTASWWTTTRCAATTARRCSGPTRRSMRRSTPTRVTTW